MKSRVLVAMSGGVDSSVAAFLLQREGYEVIGATIKTWVQTSCHNEKSKGCCSVRDIDDARAVAGRLHIPYYVLDMSERFKDKVIRNFVETYLDGNTPNPCIRCNNDIKFGMFLEKAEELGADYVATGHYARRVRHDGDAKWSIREGVDLNKDQSYVLFGLTQAQLQKTLLPVGEYTKNEIRQLALSLGLRVHDKPDSQEICFVQGHYSDVIRQSGYELPGPGSIVDQKGDKLGDHNGSFEYTIGQRKSLRIPSHLTLFVTDIRPGENKVVVGEEKDLYHNAMRIKELNWMTEPVLLEPYAVKIRSRNKKTTGHFTEIGPESAVFQFDKSEKSVAPGQAAVFYKQGVVIGGGWISERYKIQAV